MGFFHKLSFTSLIVLFTASVKAQLIDVADFGSNPGNLEMSLYLPKTDSTVELPLVVALHGCSQTSTSMAKQAGWNDLAERFGFAVLYPDQRRVNNGSNCFNWFELVDIEPMGGETESIGSMINYALSNYSLDSSRVFIYGLSAGGAMAISLMANYPNYFKAGAVFAAGPFGLATNKAEGFKAMRTVIDRTPEEWGQLVKQKADEFPALIIFHGKRDKTVPIGNAFELVDQWTDLWHTDTIADSVNSTYAGHENVTQLIYQDSAKRKAVVFFQINDIGHALPVDPGGRREQGGRTGAFARDVDFYSTYHVIREFGLASD